MNAQIQMNFTAIKSRSESYLSVVESETAQQLTTFLESYCDAFTADDFRFYADVTGKPLSWLIENARFYSGKFGAIQNAYRNGDIDLIELMSTYF
jgi:hypothetical protein